MGQDGGCGPAATRKPSHRVWQLEIAAGWVAHCRPISTGQVLDRPGASSIGARCRRVWCSRLLASQRPLRPQHAFRTGTCNNFGLVPKQNLGRGGLQAEETRRCRASIPDRHALHVYRLPLASGLEIDCLPYHLTSTALPARLASGPVPWVAPSTPPRSIHPTISPIPRPPNPISRVAQESRPPQARHIVNPACHRHAPIRS